MGPTEGTGFRLAWFISPHGFGHAARSCAAIEGVGRLRPDLEVEIFTTVPEWFLRESLSVPFRRHPVRSDVGLEQLSALEADLDETLVALRAFMPFERAIIDPLARSVVDLGCAAAVCDISPLGIEVAGHAGLPSVLVENFTWDWIYEGFIDRVPALADYVALMRATNERADLHVQTEPVCKPSVHADLVTGPVSRLPRLEREAARRALGVGGVDPLVLITMGGVPHGVDFGHELRRRSAVRFLVTGAQRTALEDNVQWFDNDTPLYLPDLVRAADVVVAKLGYSTVAEVWRENRPLAYVTRGDFRESPVLERFASSELVGFGITDVDYPTGRWLAGVDELLENPSNGPERSGGTRQLAEFIVERFG